MALTTNIRIGRFALIAAALLALGMHTLASGSAGSRHYVETAPKQTETVDPPGIYGADPELTAVIESSIDRFDSVGLTLPDLRIYYHSDPAGCPGAIAQFNQDGSGTRVDLCTRDAYTLLHELAHAWEHHTMSDATRQAYLGEPPRNTPLTQRGFDMGGSTEQQSSPAFCMENFDPGRSSRSAPR